MDALEIRLVTAEDAPGLLKVYEHYVRHTAISFEYEVPTLENFGRGLPGRGKNTPILPPWKTAESWAMPTRGRLSGGRLTIGRQS